MRRPDTKNVLVCLGANLRHTPYLNGYLEQISEQRQNAVVFYWDRDGRPDEVLPDTVTSYAFRASVRNEQPRLTKLLPLLQYRRQAMRLMRKLRPTRIVVCGTVFAVLLSDILIGKYSGRYIFDFRDPTYEHWWPYRKLVSALVTNARMTCISSDAYRELLPSCDNIFTTHNLLLRDLGHRLVRRENDRARDVLRIRFWGLVRDASVNLALIDSIINDDRFELHYHGMMDRTSEVIRGHCRERGVKNVFLHGSYLPDERYGFVRDSDLIHNAYDNARGSNPSMGNK